MAKDLAENVGPFCQYHTIRRFILLPGSIPCNEAGFGLMDYKARYYSPGLGRFISPDTVVPDFANPQSLNRYSYVLNNPIHYNDPSGHCPSCYEPQPPPGGEEVYVGWGVTTHINPNLSDRQKFGALLVDFTPFVGDAKGFAEVFTGQDLITGEDLGAWRWAGVVFLSELRLARHAGNVVDTAKFTGRHLDEAGDFAGDFFGKYNEGTVFSGAFDTSTGNFALRPSTEDINLAYDAGNEWVYRSGGHGTAAGDLNPDLNFDSIYGFTVTYVGKGQLSISSWKSGTLNGSKGLDPPLPPDPVKQQILDNLRDQTGWNVTAP